MLQGLLRVRGLVATNAVEAAIGGDGNVLRVAFVMLI